MESGSHQDLGGYTRIGASLSYHSARLALSLPLTLAASELPGAPCLAAWLPPVHTPPHTLLFNFILSEMEPNSLSP